MNPPRSLKSESERRELRALILPLLDDLHRVAMRLTHSSVEAEELVAETALRACEGFAALRDFTKAKQWMLRILTNLFITSCRTKKRYQQVLYEETDDGQPFSLYAHLSEHSDGNPERELISKLMDEDIQRALASLPVEYRLAVVLCDVEGYSYDEIAALLEIPIGTVRSRLSRGRSVLQKRLYHYAQEQGWIKPTQTGKTRHEPCECERNTLPASAGVDR
jgi:RNA polymerase sigma-70 factor (ECF subfamily)